MSVFYFFVLFLISSVKYNINYYTAIKKTYAFIIVTYAYYLNINPNTILKIISKHQLLFIYISYSIL